MQPIRHLMHHLSILANAEHCLFTPDDLRALAPDLSDSAYRALLSRAIQAWSTTSVAHEFD